MKPSLTFVTLSAVFFKLIWIFLATLMIDVTQVYKLSSFFRFFFYVSWFTFRFFILRKSSMTVLARHSLRCPLFFVIKNQITISFWKKSYHFHHPCCTINMVQVGSAKTKLNFFRYYSNISHQKIFFLNNSRWMCKLKTKNVYNWQ